MSFDVENADQIADHLLSEARSDCYCATRRKPCIEHQMYEAGMDDLINALGIDAHGNGREPQPEDGPDYHADHAFWRTANGSSREATS